MYNSDDAVVTNQNSKCLWVGCDVAKDTFEVSLATSANIKDFPTASFERSRVGVLEFLKWADKELLCRNLRDYGLRVVMEATGKYSITLTSWMLTERHEVAPAIVNPQRAKSFIDSLGLRNKTDAMDARGLACFGQQRQPPAYQPPSEAYSQLRELIRLRRELSNDRVRNKLRLGEMSEKSLAYPLLKTVVDDLQKREEEVRSAIEKLIDDDDNLRGNVDKLKGIPGVGIIVAATVLGEMGDLHRFATSRQISSFAGLSPQRYESGTSVHGRTALSKNGNSHVRSVLYMAALQIIRKKEGLGLIYQRLVVAGKSKMSAIGVVMRKLIVLMRAIVVSGKSYEECYVKKLIEVS